MVVDRFALCLSIVSASLCAPTWFSQGRLRLFSWLPSFLLLLTCLLGYSRADQPSFPCLVLLLGVAAFAASAVSLGAASVVIDALVCDCSPSWLNAAQLLSLFDYRLGLTNAVSARSQVIGHGTGNHSHAIADGCVHATSATAHGAESRGE